jgi:hypothetical protein
MSQAHRDAMSSRDTFGSALPPTRRNPFDELFNSSSLRAPAPIATSTVLGQRMDTPKSANFGYPFRTMYPDRPTTLDGPVGAAITKDPSLHAPSVHSSAHRKSPSIMESSPSMYAASLPEETDDDSLYTREIQGSRPMNPFSDVSDARAPERATSPATSAFHVTRKPAPPVPPRHRDRPLTGLVTPPASSSSHSPPTSPMVETMAAGLGLSVRPLPPPPDENKDEMLTRRTFLNVRLHLVRAISLANAVRRIDSSQAKQHRC